MLCLVSFLSQVICLIQCEKMPSAILFILSTAATIITAHAKSYKHSSISKHSVVKLNLIVCLFVNVAQYQNGIKWRQRYVAFVKLLRIIYHANAWKSARYHRSDQKRCHVYVFWYQVYQARPENA